MVVHGGGPHAGAGQLENAHMGEIMRRDDVSSPHPLADWRLLPSCRATSRHEASRWHCQSPPLS